MRGNRLLHITLVFALSFSFVPVVLAYQNFCLEFKAETNDTMVIAKHSDSLNIIGELTMEAWIYPTKVLDRAMIVAKFDTWNVSLHNMTLEAAINSAKWAHDGGGEVELNKWSHVAVSFDTKEYHTFVNGKYQVSISDQGAIKPSHPARIFMLAGLPGRSHLVDLSTKSAYLTCPDVQKARIFRCLVENLSLISIR